MVPNQLPDDELRRQIDKNARLAGKTPERYLRELISGGSDNGLYDDEYVAACQKEADPSVTHETVRKALSKIPHSLTPDFIAERDE